MKDFIVTEMEFDGKNRRIAAFYEDGKLSELQIENAGSSSLVGRVYKGYVERVVRNIGGAFCECGLKEKVFLPLNAAERKKIHGSSPILLQITKDAAGQKVPVATENIHLSGRCAVVSSEGSGIAFSRKLSEENRELLKKWIPAEMGEKYHVLIRTNAIHEEKKDVLSELKELIRRMDEVLADGQKAGTGEMVDTPEPFYLSMVRDLYESPDRVFSDIPKIAEELRPFAADQGERPALFEKSTLSLAEIYNVKRDLERLSSKTVYLKSGAYLVIEQTEAFVSVDVNTGKCEKGRKPEETYRRINIEAAEELARQIRLRNLSGMILVDFINMKSADHREELLNRMKKSVRRDHVHTEVLDLTRLGIMEMIRQKIRKPLAEVLSM